MNDKKITNVKTTVTLKKDYTYTYYGVDTTIPKGTKFDVRDVRPDGLVIVLGHGAAEVIPRQVYQDLHRQEGNLGWSQRMGVDSQDCQGGCHRCVARLLEEGGC